MVRNTSEAFTECLRCVNSVVYISPRTVPMRIGINEKNDRLKHTDPQTIAISDETRNSEGNTHYVFGCYEFAGTVTISTHRYKVAYRKFMSIKSHTHI